MWEGVQYIAARIDVMRDAPQACDVRWHVCAHTHSLRVPRPKSVLRNAALESKVLGCSGGVHSKVTTMALIICPQGW